MMRVAWSPRPSSAAKLYCHPSLGGRAAIASSEFQDRGRPPTRRWRRTIAGLAVFVSRPASISSRPCGRGCRACRRQLVVRWIAVVGVAGIAILGTVADALIALPMRRPAGLGLAACVAAGRARRLSMSRRPSRAASPLNVPPVTVMAAPARTVPRKLDVVSVAASLTHHVTLQSSPPLIITTLKFVPVSAPSTRNVQAAFGSPPASSVNVPVFAVASTQ